MCIKDSDYKSIIVIIFVFIRCLKSFLYIIVILVYNNRCTKSAKILSCRQKSCNKNYYIIALFINKWTRIVR